MKDNCAEVVTLNNLIDRVTENQKNNIGAGKPLTRSQVESILKDGFSGIQAVVSAGKEVRINGFGKFSLVTRKARIGRNPQTGDVLEIKETQVAKFVPSKSAKMDPWNFWV